MLIKRVPIYLQREGSFCGLVEAPVQAGLAPGQPRVAPEDALEAVEGGQEVPPGGAQAGEAVDGQLPGQPRLLPLAPMIIGVLIGWNGERR